MMGMQRQEFSRLWMIPMKGKGWDITARNIASGAPIDLSRPLTTDDWDNVILYEEQEADEHCRESH